VLISLFRLVKNQRIDVVCLGLVGIESFFVMFLRHFIAFRLIVYLHGGEMRSYIRVSPYMRWSLKECLRLCDAAIAVSEKLREETIAFEPLVKNKITVLPGGIDIEQIRMQGSYQHRRPYILYAGRLHPVKGVDVLIQAIQRVSTRVPDLDLLVAGTGPLESSLRQLAADSGLADRVLFLGDQERSTVFTLLKGCEFLVLPSHAEGCPTVVLEAMAAGKLTLGSRVKGIRELVEEGKTGAFFERGDVDGLAKLILEYHGSPNLRCRLEENIRATSLAAYDMRSLASRHLEIYRGLKPILRIGVISLFYYRDDSCVGLASYYFNLVTSLSKLGHHVYLVTAESTPPGMVGQGTMVSRIKGMSQDFVPQGLVEPVFERVKRLASRLLFSYRAFLKVRSLDRSVGLDLVVAPELFAQGLFVALRMRKKLITRIHTPTYIGDRYNERYRFPWIGRILSLPEKWQARMSRGISVASTHLASVIVHDWGIPQDRIHIVPNSVQVDWIRSLAAEQGREIQGDYLLYFGRLERRKGVHILSCGLPSVFTRRSDIRMVFIGKDCGLQKEILTHNRDFQSRISFFDTMEKGKLFGVIRSAKLVILPSLFENFSNAGLEAMALGKPVVATHGTAFEEIIQDGVNGFLVEPGDAEALAQKILSCLERTDLGQIGENAYQSVLRFDSLKVAQQIIDSYQAALSRA
jgi:glycosyltransferase involved in cell wall biosynthesis